MAVATAWGVQMTQLVGNIGGGIQSLPSSNIGGPPFVETLTLAAQASGTTIGVARIPLYATFLGITLVSTVSLGTAQLSFGDTNNATLYAAAATLTVTTPTMVGAAAAFVPITSGYDSVTGNLVGPFMPQLVGQGGALYEDIVMVTSVASLPGSGTLKILTNWILVN